MRTTESIYDRPSRDRASLGTTSPELEGRDLRRLRQEHRADRILGCTTYGFTQHYDAKAATFEPVQQIAPGCGRRPTANFTTTLASDPTTSSYAFRPAPLLECFNPTPPATIRCPRGDTRIA